MIRYRRRFKIFENFLLEYKIEPFIREEFPPKNVGGDN